MNVSNGSCSDPPNANVVQHVTKASSDQLLSKFAEVGSEAHEKFPAKELRLVKRRKKNSAAAGYQTARRESTGGASVPERKSLLVPAASSRRSSALIWRLGIGKARVRARDFKSRSLMGTIEKTWHRTVEGASKVFIEKHYNRHKRLINDMS